MISDGGSPKTRARLERPASCTEKNYNFGAALQCIIVCRLQAAQTDDRAQFYIYFSIFKLSRDYMYRGSK